ncbi:hypothetical protein COCNU_05G005150 [Cocos nucifera]|uniref:Uncharacterized protein n=1 Tax=Cocos nucifera TaxID=13894 RepID=A0A8K0I8X4_COCNU|nr:hypothetical protein COCNU_05G005150 [Cocos nucifera]
MRSSPFSRTSSSPATTNPISSSAAGRICILSIDGGGSAFDGPLAHLGAFLCKLSDDPTSQIADFFDLAARSGASGVLVVMLFIRASNGHPLSSVNEAHCLLSENRARLATSDEQGFLRRIFQRSGGGDEVFFRWIFGDAMLWDTMKPVLVPCYDLFSRGLVLSLSLSLGGWWAAGPPPLAPLRPLQASHQVEAPEDGKSRGKAGKAEEKFNRKKREIREIK